MNRLLENLAATKLLWVIVGSLIAMAILIFVVTGIQSAIPQTESQDTVSTTCYIYDRYTTSGIRIAKGFRTRQYYFAVMVLDDDDTETYTIEVSKRTYGSYGEPMGGIPCSVTYKNGRITNLVVLDDNFNQITDGEGIARDFVLFALSLTITGVVLVLFGHRKKL